MDLALTAVPSRPRLMILATDDTISPSDLIRAAFARESERLLEVEGGHYGIHPWSRGQSADQAGQVATEWVRLAPPAIDRDGERGSPVAPFPDANPSLPIAESRSWAVRRCSRASRRRRSRHSDPPSTRWPAPSFLTEVYSSWSIHSPVSAPE
jgi:hypothetical protein